ncbi:MAG: DNA-processing protein DprA, partial [Candidatus Omnitrophica bacterium]|nr:DNA-processing protein DprA [Candidatus Omnitrophota bacterium]
RFGYQLASVGVTVVSGMARGIDTSAHRGSLKAKGRTFAVLGSGLLNIYPPENIKLAEDISINGAVISEFPLYMPPLSENFPRRNRIISGLSRAVLVVEAAKRSGALITADLALEQGRDVFAIPGKVDSPTSFGTNYLIKQGAKLIDSVADILDEYNIKENEQRLQAALSEQELSVVEHIKDGAQYIDDIAMRSGLSTPKLNSILLSLEIKGIIKNNPGDLYTIR